MVDARLQSLLNKPAQIAAPMLLGCELVVERDGVIAGGVIVETEAYAEHDEASHTFKGRTARNGVMFGSGGGLYVYFTYGMHYCLNITVGAVGTGEAVLIRAIEPTRGIDAMWRRRYSEPLPVTPSQKRLQGLTSGPAKLSQALGVDLAFNGYMLGDADDDSIRAELHRPNRRLQDDDVVQTTRIGISRAIDVPWRWYVKGSVWVSRR